MHSSGTPAEGKYESLDWDSQWSSVLSSSIRVLELLVQPPLEDRIGWLRQTVYALTRAPLEVVGSIVWTVVSLSFFFVHLCVGTLNRLLLQLCKLMDIELDHRQASYLEVFTEAFGIQVIVMIWPKIRFGSLLQSFGSVFIAPLVILISGAPYAAGHLIGAALVAAGIALEVVDDFLFGGFIKTSVVQPILAFMKSWEIISIIPPKEPSDTSADYLKLLKSCDSPPLADSYVKKTYASVVSRLFFAATVACCVVVLSAGLSPYSALLAATILTGASLINRVTKIILVNFFPARAQYIGLDPSMRKAFAKDYPVSAFMMNGLPFTALVLLTLAWLSPLGLALLPSFPLGMAAAAVTLFSAVGFGARRAYWNCFFNSILDTSSDIRKAFSELPPVCYDSLDFSSKSGDLPYDGFGLAIAIALAPALEDSEERNSSVVRMIHYDILGRSATFHKFSVCRLENSSNQYKVTAIERPCI